MSKVLDIERLGTYTECLKSVLGILCRNVDYNIDEVVRYKAKFLKCLKTGKTGSEDLDLSLAENNVINDGTTIWKIITPVSKDEVSQGISDGVPLGIILPLTHNGAVPDGYLLCDGSAISRTGFAELFEAIGTIYGNGDGETTFNLPDYNQAKRFVQGDMEAGIEKEAGLPNIEGTLPILYSNKGYSKGAFNATGYNFALAGGESVYGQVSGTFNASRYNSIYGKSTTVQPPALTVRYIIKAFDNQYVKNLYNYDTDFTIIYPNGGTKENPANITVNSRYVEPNPFEGYYVHCVAEVFYNGQWGAAPNDSNAGSGGYGLGVMAYNYDNSVVVQVACSGLISTSNIASNPFGFVGTITTAPCRVKVWKIGKISVEQS